MRPMDKSRASFSILATRCTRGHQCLLSSTGILGRYKATSPRMAANSNILFALDDEQQQVLFGLFTRRRISMAGKPTGRSPSPRCPGCVAIWRRRGHMSIGVGGLCAVRPTVFQRR